MTRKLLNFEHKLSASHRLSALWFVLLRKILPYIFLSLKFELIQYFLLTGISKVWTPEISPVITWYLHCSTRRRLRPTWIWEGVLDISSIVALSSRRYRWKPIKDDRLSNRADKVCHNIRYTKPIPVIQGPEYLQRDTKRDWQKAKRSFLRKSLKITYFFSLLLSPFFFYSDSSTSVAAH